MWKHQGIYTTQWLSPLCTVVSAPLGYDVQDEHTLALVVKVVSWSPTCKGYLDCVGHHQLTARMVREGGHASIQHCGVRLQLWTSDVIYRHLSAVNFLVVQKILPFLRKKSIKLPVASTKPQPLSTYTKLCNFLLYSVSNLGIMIINWDSQRAQTVLIIQFYFPQTRLTNYVGSCLLRPFKCSTSS